MEEVAEYGGRNSAACYDATGNPMQYGVVLERPDAESTIAVCLT